MTKYEVSLVEEVRHTIVVEANSLEEAQTIAVKAHTFNTETFEVDSMGVIDIDITEL